MQRMALVLAVVLLALVSPSVLHADEREVIEEYEKLLASGDTEAAVKTGSRVLAGLEYKYTDSRAISLIRERVAMISKVGSLASHKLNVIAETAGSDAPSAFLFAAPKPEDLFRQADSQLHGLAISTEGFSSEEATFVRSYLRAVVFCQDEKVVQAYQKVADSMLEGAIISKSRAYLSAHVTAVHDESNYSGVLSLLGKTAKGRQLPVFLVEDAIVVFGSIRAAEQAMTALAGVTYAHWPQGQEARLLKTLALLAEKNGRDDRAVVAYGKIVTTGCPAEAEEAQSAIIRIYAEKYKDYGRAALACAEYLRRFSDGKEALIDEYREARYKYLAGDLDAALLDVKQFQERHPDSLLTPEALVLEGLVRTDQERFNDALESFSKVLGKYPNHRLAGLAQFLIGNVYVSSQRYREARDAFQRVVDFHPEDENVAEAKRLLADLDRALGAAE